MIIIISHSPLLLMEQHDHKRLSLFMISPNFLLFRTFPPLFSLSPFLWFPLLPPSRSSWWRASRPVRGDLSCEREAEGGAPRVGAEGGLILVTRETGRHPGTPRDTQGYPEDTQETSEWVVRGAVTCLRKSLSINSGHRDTLQLDMGLQAQKRLRTEVSFLHHISFVT